MGRRKLSEDQIHKTKIIFKGKPHLHYKNDTTIDFKVPKANPLFAKALQKPALPKFTNDRKYYTPAFALINLDEFKDPDCQAIHQQKVAESLKEIDEDQIMIAKPSSKFQFCGVCKKCYDDYLTHLEEAQHMKLLSESKYQKQILVFCRDFQKIMQQPTESNILKKASAQTKINEQQSYTECLIEDKKNTGCDTMLVLAEHS